MRVKLKSARAGHILGERIERPEIPQEARGPEYRILGTFAQEPGDVIDVPEPEARRMIQGGIAAEVAGK